jgi:hypothetical protein
MSMAASNTATYRAPGPGRDRAFCFVLASGLPKFVRFSASTTLPSERKWDGKRIRRRGPEKHTCECEIRAI